MENKEDYILRTDIEFLAKVAHLSDYSGLIKKVCNAAMQSIALRKEVEELKQSQAEDRLLITSLSAELDASDLVWSKEVPELDYEQRKAYWMMDDYGEVYVMILEGSEKDLGLPEFGHWVKFCPIPEPKEAK